MTSGSDNPKPGFVPAGGHWWWPFSIGVASDGRLPPRNVRRLLVRGFFRAALRRQPRDPRAYWSTWSRDALARLMHALGAGVDHPSRTFMAEAIRDGETVLDVGCGAGVNYEVLRAVGRSDGYLGVDSSAPSIDVAREMYPDGTFVLGDAEALVAQFGPQSFDVVVVRHVLEHLPDYQPALAEAIAVSRRLAIIVFFLTPRALPLGVRKLDPGISAPFYAYVCSRRAIERDLSAAGLHWSWHGQLGPSRTSWLFGEVNTALLISRNSLA